jgi:putative peptidoglycan lipid II flippase
VKNPNSPTPPAELPVDSTPSQSATGKAVAKATAGIGVLHLLRLLIGFVTAPLIARIFGSNWRADVYSVATDIVQSLWLVFEKTVNPTVLPLFSRALKDEDEKSAWHFASLAFIVTTLGVILVTPIAWFGMPFIVGIYSQKAGAEQQDVTIAVARLLLSGLFFLSLSSLTYVILNGYKRFAVAALGDAFWRLGIMVAAAWCFTRKLPMDQALYILSYGFLFGAFLKLAPQIWALRSKWHLFIPKVDWSDPRLKAALWLSIPLLVGVATSESRDIYRNWLSDSPIIKGADGQIIEGSRAVLKF